MERDLMTKADLHMTYMEPKSQKQFKAAIRFYESKGFEVSKFYIQRAEMISEVSYKKHVKSYLVVIHGGNIKILTSLSIHPSRFKKLPIPYNKRRTFPRKMMVSNDGSFWAERMIVAKAKTIYPFIGVSPPFELEDQCDIPLKSWLFAREIK